MVEINVPQVKPRAERSHARPANTPLPAMSGMIRFRGTIAEPPFKDIVPVDQLLDETTHAQTRRRSVASIVRLSLACTVVLAGIAYGLAGLTAAQGVLLGGIAGVFGFWMMAARLQRLSTTSPERLHGAMLVGVYVRLIVYAIFLYVAYLLDPSELRGFFGALAGLVGVRFVPPFAALARARADRTRSQAGEPRPPDS
jgi:hypothetical protein